ncbi:MAG: hypothetical protein AAFY26_05950 [Cyanobacteria bacterium J06638_22]
MEQNFRAIAHASDVTLQLETDRFHRLVDAQFFQNYPMRSALYR